MARRSPGELLFQGGFPRLSWRECNFQAGYVEDAVVAAA